MKKKIILKRIKYFLKFLPDKIYIQIYYFMQFKKFANLKNPTTFNEKLNWLKLNDRNEKYINLVDKYEAKKEVEKIIGKDYIIPTIGIYDNFDDIDFEKLPNSFVIKCTHDSEGIVICKNKKKFNKEIARKKINEALKYNFYYIGREWPYKNIKPRIMIEQYMEDSKYGELRDYKFFCFDGTPKAMFIASNRGEGTTKFDYYDLKFNHLPIVQHYPNSDVIIDKPQKFDEMIILAKNLSRKIPHVRIDFYEVNGKVYFGEFTLYHFSGFQPFTPNEWDEIFGKWIKIQNNKHK